MINILVTMRENLNLPTDVVSNESGIGRWKLRRIEKGFDEITEAEKIRLKDYYKKIARRKILILENTIKNLNEI